MFVPPSPYEHGHWHEGIRPCSYSRIMMELELKAYWSTCQRLWVASALVDNDMMVRIPAYNGTPRHQPSCRELTTPDVRCAFCVHSEKNTINHAAKAGVATQGLSLFTLRRPCLGCSNDIVQAGISAVFYRWDYESDSQRDYVLEMYTTNSIFFRQLEMTPLEVAFHEMMLKFYQENRWMPNDESLILTQEQWHDSVQ